MILQRIGIWHSGAERRTWAWRSRVQLPRTEKWEDCQPTKAIWFILSSVAQDPHEALSTVHLSSPFPRCNWQATSVGLNIRTCKVYLSGGGQGWIHHQVNVKTRYTYLQVTRLRFILSCLNKTTWISYFNIAIPLYSSVLKTEARIANNNSIFSQKNLMDFFYFHTYTMQRESTMNLKTYKILWAQNSGCDKRSSIVMYYNYVVVWIQI